MTATTDSKRTALEWIDGNHQRLSRFHSGIWEHAEAAWHEYRSAGAVG